MIWLLESFACTMAITPSLVSVPGGTELAGGAGSAGVGVGVGSAPSGTGMVAAACLAAASCAAARSWAPLRDIHHHPPPPAAITAAAEAAITGTSMFVFLTAGFATGGGLSGTI